MSNNLTYLINKSQGFHVHLSHPDLKSINFVKLWRIFQPVIQNFVPDWRRKSKWSKPLVDDYPSKENAVFPVDENHVEVRIYQGTAVYLEIYMWVLFCLLFARASILKNIEELEISNKDMLVEMLFSLIEDKYNKNKVKEFPTISKQFNKVIIPDDILTKEQWKKIKENADIC